MLLGSKGHRRYPLNVLVVGAHHHEPSSWSADIIERLLEHENIKSCGFTDEPIETCNLIKRHNFDSVFYNLRGQESFAPSAYVINAIRLLFPHVVFVLHGRKDNFVEFIRRHPRFAHYLFLDVAEFDINFHRAVVRCVEWHQRQAEYDIAISFASEDLEIARDLHSKLVNSGAKVFMYLDRQSDALGTDLADYISNIYLSHSRYCIAVISDAYLSKPWTQREFGLSLRRGARAKSDYFIPLVVSDTELPRFILDKCYVPKSRDLNVVARDIVGKLWNDAESKSGRLIYVSRNNRGANIIEDYPNEHFISRDERIGQGTTQVGESFYPFFRCDFVSKERVDLEICGTRMSKRRVDLATSEGKVSVTYQASKVLRLFSRRSGYPFFSRTFNFGSPVSLNSVRYEPEQLRVNLTCSHGFSEPA